jgi:hypothetical protein
MSLLGWMCYLVITESDSNIPINRKKNFCFSIYLWDVFRGINIDSVHDILQQCYCQRVEKPLGTCHLILGGVQIDHSLNIRGSHMRDGYRTLNNRRSSSISLSMF